LARPLKDTNLRVGELSEILVLSVLDRLGSAEIPQIFESLQLATMHGRAPFFVGSTLGQLLQWRLRSDEVQEEKRNHVSVYRITDQGKKTVNRYGPVVLRYFPNLSKIKSHHADVDSGI
jgi:hypothetical protein